MEQLNTKSQKMHNPNRKQTYPQNPSFSIQNSNPQILPYQNVNQQNSRQQPNYPKYTQIPNQNYNQQSSSTQTLPPWILTYLQGNLKTRDMKLRVKPSSKIQVIQMKVHQSNQTIPQPPILSFYSEQPTAHGQVPINMPLIPQHTKLNK